MSAMALAPTMPRTAVRNGVRTTARPTVSPAERSTARSARSALHLTRRGRVVLWMLALVLVAGAVLMTSRAAAGGPERAQEVERHVVEPGETMWQIASDVAAPGQDVRDVVFDLVKLNDLSDAGLMAGQVIVVPAG